MRAGTIRRSATMDFANFTERARGALQAAQMEALAGRHQNLLPEHLLKALLEDPLRGLFTRAGVNPTGLAEAVDRMRQGRKADAPSAEQNWEALKKYARDLTEEARQGKLDPVIGRDDEIRRTIQVLARRTKNN